MGNPTMQHHKTAKKDISYLKGSPRHGLFFSCASKLQVFGFSELIWVDVWIAISPFWDTISFLVIPLSPGSRKKYLLFLILPWRLSIRPRL